MKKYFLHVLFSFFCFLLLTTLPSCEDVVDVELREGTSLLAVDAVLTSDPGIQTIKLRKTAPYLKNAPTPPALGANVEVKDVLGRKFTFTDPDNDGNYEWIANPATLQEFLMPLAFRPFGKPNFYTLKIKYEGDEYEATQILDTVPVIDTLKVNYVEQEVFGSDTVPPGYRLNMYAVDPKNTNPKMPNCYWFRTYRNGILYNKPNEMVFAYDAAFGPGSDGVAFIPPIARRLAPERLDVGDTITVECLSVGLHTYLFLMRAQTEMVNAGIFASPPANVFTNIINVKEGGKKAVGWFTMANISRKGLRIKKI